MAGRTYRYLAAEPMYPFGYGLSYAKFAYSAAKLSVAKVAKNQPVEVTATVTNTGSDGRRRSGAALPDAPAQGWHPNAAVCSQKAFRRVQPGRRGPAPR